jgi:hypothetical protein
MSISNLSNVNCTIRIDVLALTRAVYTEPLLHFQYIALTVIEVQSQGGELEIHRSCIHRSASLTVKVSPVRTGEERRLKSLTDPDASLST